MRTGINVDTMVFFDMLDKDTKKTYKVISSKIKSLILVGLDTDHYRNVTSELKNSFQYLGLTDL